MGRNFTTETIKPTEKETARDVWERRNSHENSAPKHNGLGVAKTQGGWDPLKDLNELPEQELEGSLTETDEDDWMKYINAGKSGDADKTTLGDTLGNNLKNTLKNALENKEEVKEFTDIPTQPEEQEKEQYNTPPLKEMTKKEKEKHLGFVNALSHTILEKNPKLAQEVYVMQKRVEDDIPSATIKDEVQKTMDALDEYSFGILKGDNPQHLDERSLNHLFNRVQELRELEIKKQNRRSKRKFVKKSA